MNVLPVNNINSQPVKSRKKINFVKVTGYGSIVFASASIFAASKHKIKTHKALGITSLLLALVHVGLIKYFHSKYKKNVQSK